MTGITAALWEDGGTGVGPLRLLGAAAGAPPLSIRSRLLGAFVHLAVGLGLAPAAYGALFHALGRADALVGLALGLAHSVLAGALLPLLYTRGRYPGGAAPGVFGHRWGATLPLGIVFAHAVYGTLLGYIYV